MIFKENGREEPKGKRKKNTPSDAFVSVFDHRAFQPKLHFSCALIVWKVTQWNLFLFINFIRIVTSIFLVLWVYHCLIAFCQGPVCSSPLKMPAETEKACLALLFCSAWNGKWTSIYPTSLRSCWFHSSSAITFWIFFPLLHPVTQSKCVRSTSW